MRLGNLKFSIVGGLCSIGLLAALVTGCDEDPGPTCKVEPTLTSIQANVFGTGPPNNKGCTFSSCHDSGRPMGDLDLATPGVHARLVNVVAENVEGEPITKLLVVPGDPDNSFLIQKLEGTQGRDEGYTMPGGSKTNPNAEVVDPECRIAMVRQWILDGALDN